MRTHILYTGGTLGMVPTPDGLAPGADLTGWLDQLLSGTELAGTFETLSFEHLIDSANATPADWGRIVDNLWAHREEADSFVVLHGTDTLAYTSAALSYALTDFGKPVVVTGSQYSLGVVGTDAAPNVTGALRAVTSGRLHGVAVFFGHKLLRGNRVTKSSSWAYNGFDSPAAPQLARTGAPWQWIENDSTGCGWLDPRPYRRHDVLVVDLSPGLSAARLRAVLDPLPEAVILRAFGVGNVPSDEPGLVDVILDVISAGTPVVVASQCMQADVLLGHYQSSHALAEGGAISAHDMTLEALYAKLVFLLSQGLRGKELGRWVETDIAGEISM
ncbi:MAG: asparaginase [Cutibacterium avidum]|uniref:asparaginase n=1 Tax=Cutibacterium avidum TaxID=33010 RepID=UPI00080FE9E5|nr:asparaginase [Cutibacterium avidum]MBS5745674.1 asparaginase [Propionibacterium sp.]MDK7358301.1 asparaginase [Cutibacterium avidum]MDK7371965.1 asparaginase [Cutibacterium avidum]MDU3220229.1 asparaginase [Cutibacterium avidum]MDU3749631.1 asparaginase [Cutibacterium avidum]